MRALLDEHTIAGNFSGQTAAIFDSLAIRLFLNHYPAFKLHTDEILRFYRGRHFAYAWFERGTLIEQAGNLANRMLNLRDEGLIKTVPYATVLDSLVHTGQKGKPDPSAELMLTAQYFVFAGLAWQGIDLKASAAAGWYLPRKKVDYAAYLDSLLAAPASGEPVYRQYELLRSFLRKYRDLQLKQQAWKPLRPPPGGLIQGDTSKVIPAVRSRLYALEDLRGDTLNRAFDSNLEMAVSRFQQRHGLKADGKLGPETMNELNVPLSERISQLIVNMERCRWLPVRLDGDYLGVNIPEFQLHAYRADSLLWSCKVVVGQRVHQTTLFYGEVRYVVFSPYWDVPASIVRNELLPEMKKNPGYMAAHHMELMGYKDGLPVIRQRTGADNPLGLVKFLFPNSYSIYLHDTPSKSLFGETARAFSHGCIRVAEPIRLAAFLLRNQPGWDTLKITREMHTGKERYVALTRRVPVFIAYLTAFTDRAGQLNFRKDIYQLDKPLADMMLVGE